MITKIGKINFAINAEWSRLLSKDDPVQSVKDKRKRFYTLIEAKRINVRYLGCYNIVKSQPKLYSLASCFFDLTEGNHDSFIFVHEFDNKLYYLAYRDGVFDVKTDKALSVNDGKRAIRDYVQSNNIKHLYYFDNLSDADSLFVENSHVLDSSSMGAINKSHHIQNVDKFSVSIKTLFAAFFFIGLIGLISYSIINEYFQDSPIVDKVRKGPTPAEISQYKADAIKSKLNVLYSTPYSNDLILNCEIHKLKIPLNLKFWDRVSYLCEHTDITYTYSRKDFGIVPSEFSSYLTETYLVDSTKNEFSLPVKVSAKYTATYMPRTFIPESVDDVSEGANANILDVLARYSDIQSVNSLNEPTIISMGFHELKGEQITFNKNELYKKGSFTLRSTNLKDLINVNSLFDADYTFLDSISYKGDFYDAKYTYITL